MRTSTDLYELKSMPQCIEFVAHTGLLDVQISTTQLITEDAMGFVYTAKKQPMYRSVHPMRKMKQSSDLVTLTA